MHLWCIIDRLDTRGVEHIHSDFKHVGMFSMRGYEIPSSHCNETLHHTQEACFEHLCNASGSGLATTWKWNKEQRRLLQNALAAFAFAWPPLTCANGCQGLPMVVTNDGFLLPCALINIIGIPWLSLINIDMTVSNVLKKPIPWFRNNTNTVACPMNYIYSRWIGEV